MPLPKGLKKNINKKEEPTSAVSDDLDEMDILFPSSSPNLSDFEQIKLIYEEAISLFFIDFKKAITLFRAVVHECTRIGIENSSIPNSTLFDDDYFFIIYGNSLFSLAILEEQDELFVPSKEQYDHLRDSSMKSFLIGRVDLFQNDVIPCFDDGIEVENFFEVLDILIENRNDDLVGEFRKSLIKHLLLRENEEQRVIELFLDFSSEFIDGIEDETDLNNSLFNDVLKRLSIVCEKLNGLEGRKLEAEYYLLLGSVLEMVVEDFSSSNIHVSIRTADEAYSKAKEIYNTISLQYKEEIPQMILDL